MTFTPVSVTQQSDFSVWLNTEIAERRAWLVSNARESFFSGGDYANIEHAAMTLDLPIGKHVISTPIILPVGFRLRGGAPVTDTSRFGTSISSNPYSQRAGVTTIDCSALTAGQYPIIVQNNNSADGVGDLNGNQNPFPNTNESDRFRHYSTGASVESLRFVGGGVAGCNGLIVGNTIDAGNGDERSTRGLIARDIELHRFRNALVFGNHDTYLCTLENIVIGDCYSGIGISSGATESNRGERMVINNLIIYGITTNMIELDSPACNLNISNVSLDFTKGNFVYIGRNCGYLTLALDKYWLESFDGVPFLSDAVESAVNHIEVVLGQGFYLPRNTTVPVWAGGVLANTGGSKTPLGKGFMTFKAKGLTLANERRFSNPSGLFLFDEKVRVDTGGMDIMFRGLNSGWAQPLVSESLVSNYNHDFSASNSTLDGWTRVDPLGWAITPTLQSPAPVNLGANPLTTSTSTPNVLTVAYTGHGLVPGDVITMAGADTIAGVPTTRLNTTHVVQTTPTADTFTIYIPDANASTTGGGNNPVTIKKANFMRLTSGANNGYNVLKSSKLFPVIPGRMLNTNVHVRTAVGTTGNCVFRIGYEFFDEAGVKLPAPYGDSRLANTSLADVYNNTGDPDNNPGNRSRQVMGIGSYVKVPRWAAKAGLYLDINLFGNGDVVDVYRIATTSMDR